MGAMVPLVLIQFSSLGDLMQQLYDELAGLTGSIPSDLNELTQGLMDQLQSHQRINATQVSAAGAVTAALIAMAALLIVRYRARKKATI